MAYVDKTRRNDTANVWHARMGHVSYHKLQVMMNKFLVNDLPNLGVRKNVVCVREPIL